MLISSLEPDSNSLYSSGELITCGVSGKLRLTGSRICAMVTVELAVIENTACRRLTRRMSDLKSGRSGPLCKAETFHPLMSGQRQTYLDCVFYPLGLIPKIFKTQFIYEVFTSTKTFIVCNVFALPDVSNNPQLKCSSFGFEMQTDWKRRFLCCFFLAFFFCWLGFCCCCSLNSSNLQYPGSAAGQILFTAVASVRFSRTASPKTVSVSSCFGVRCV